MIAWKATQSFGKTSLGNTKSGAFASILSLWGTFPLFQGSSEMVCKRAALQFLFQPCQEIYRAFSVPGASSCTPKVVLHHIKPSSCRDGGTQQRASTHRDARGAQEQHVSVTTSCLALNSVHDSVSHQRGSSPGVHSLPSAPLPDFCSCFRLLWLC